MKISLLMLFFCFFTMTAGNIFSQQKELSLELNNVTLKKAIDEIEETSDYVFLFTDEARRELDKKASIRANKESIQAILEIILNGTGLDYKTIGRQVAVYKSPNSTTTDSEEVIVVVPEQQGKTVRGKVFDEYNRPLPGVTIVIKGTSLGTISNQNGDYLLTNVSEEAVLVFSFVGMKSVEIGVENKEIINVTLEEESIELEEVVAVGYGVQKKVNLTGAVSQVSSDVIENRPAPNLTRLLQGTLPNLNIKMADGSPTRTAEYNIRGMTSIGAGGSALILIDGIEGDPNLLNPNDVENVSILKDASSAAIYGSRAAFGVVLITTKSAKRGKPNINFNICQSFNQRTVNPNLITNGYEWVKNFDEAYHSWNDYIIHPSNINTFPRFSLEYLERLKEHDENPNLPKVVYNEQSKSYEYFGNVDWFDLLYKDVMPSTDIALNVTGGGENSNFYVSGRHYNQSGIFNYSPDNYNRFNVRAKGEIKANEWLTFQENFDISTYTYDYPLMASGDGGIWRQINISAFPVTGLKNPDGTWTQSAAYTIASFIEGNSQSKRNNFYVRNTAAVVAEPIKDILRFKADFTFSKNWDKDRRWNNYVYYSNAENTLSRYGDNRLRHFNDETTYWVSNITANVTKMFHDTHTINGLIGINIEKNRLEQLITNRDILLVESKPDYNLMDGLNYRITGGGNDWAYIGFFYRLNYNYLNKYLLEFNGRYDGSSKFPINQQWGFFPSISAGWTITEEPFMENMKKTINHLKMRASYGTLGNGNVAPYQFLETMSVLRTGVILEGVQPAYTSMPGVIPDGLTWEKATTFDVGLDLILLNQKLSFTYDWYNRKTVDMFTTGTPLPKVFGATEPYGNYADLSTKGWELTLSWKDKFMFAGKPFIYSFSGSLWDSKSFITKYNSPVDEFGNPVKLVDSYYVGKEIGEIWGYETLGLFTSEEDIANHANQSYLATSSGNKWLPGDIKFADLNNDKVINQGANTVENPGDRRIIGNNSPRYQFGFTVAGNWNGFGVSAFFQGIGKRDWYFARESDFFWGPYNRPYAFQPVKLFENMWSEDNPNGYFPRYRGYIALYPSRTLGAPQTRYLQDVSYIRLKNLMIDYTLPTHIIEKVKLSNAQIFVSGQNILTFSGLFKYTDCFDPEIIESPLGEMTNSNGPGHAYPMLKTWTIGLNLTF